ncbi:E3 ubiquitin-protein ligase Topors-like [Hemicordylus capensis]|uniref:E3 ubiquitin-protein ligase Topors-like n=1 Tax=Hemicordylus capensis TaxID=884348 RepID=UPI0023032114|nr:E3 ubiquitin-protein ligase Topors-like [Hemicordylus capensis]XP_053154657.1 E3 ubiquitin-protein ligase Topors-like [Hemicordylus capensis]XP_053154659.1 E3 ubiquitin-protein ligase Topors-like [Hemicordylus capensis]
MKTLHKEFRSKSEGCLVKSMPSDIAENSKCAICLQRIQDTTYLNPCNHRFCFECIQKWSRKKVKCPLCKQCFHSFFHNVTTKGEFCEYVLPLNDGTFAHSESRETHASTSSQRPMSPPDNGILQDEIRGTLTQREKDIYQLMRQFAVTKTPANIDVITLGKFKAQAVIHFRRALYHTGIFVQNAKKLDFNQIASAEFFSRNPSSVNRLIPWLKRELKVLCGNQKQLIHTLQSLILNNMTQHNLQSKEFEALLLPYLRHFTTHFLHEFISFVKSPFNVKKYDWNSSYGCPALSREDSDSFISSASDDDDHSQGPDNDQAPEVSGNLEDGNLGYLHSSPELDLAAMFTKAEGINHSNNQGNDLEDLFNIDTEKEKDTPDNCLKNKMVMLPPDTKAQPAVTFAPHQMLQFTKKNEDTGKPHPIQVHVPEHTEASKNSPHLLASGDYNVFSCDQRDVAPIAVKQNTTKKETIKWQQSSFSTSNLHHPSSEWHTTLSPGRKHIFKKSKSRGIECSLGEAYSPTKDRRRGRSRTRLQCEGRQCTNYASAKDGRLSREQRRSRSREGNLFCKSDPSLRSENIVTRDMKKSKSQNTHHFRKLKSKDYDYLRNEISSEPSWRCHYYRQDCERYRYEEPLCSKGELSRDYSRHPLVISRERLYFPTENKISVDQESLTKGCFRSERCRSARRSRGRFALVRPEERSYNKLNGKIRQKSNHMDIPHGRRGYSLL